MALVARGLFFQPLAFVSTPGLSLALDNCVCVLIGATMLYNAYIISQGEHSVSVLRSRRHRVHVGGRIWESLWVDLLPPSPAWLLLLIPGMGGGLGERGPFHTSCLGLRKKGWLGSLHHHLAHLFSLAQGNIWQSGCHSCALRPILGSWGPWRDRWVW